METRAGEGSAEPRGRFHYANRRAGFISASAPGLPGWEGKPGSEGSSRLAPTRASSASSSSSSLRRSHGPPPPPAQTGERVFLHSPARRPSSLGRDPTSLSGQSATGAGEALLGQANTAALTLCRRVFARRKTGETSGRKKVSARAIYPNRGLPSHPLKNPRPSLSLVRRQRRPRRIPPQNCPAPRGPARLGM